MNRFLRNCILIFFVMLIFCTGCSSKIREQKNAPCRDNTPQVLVPCATGVTVYTSDAATLDASNASEGYIMVKYNGNNSKVKLQIATPKKTTYTYLLSGHDLLETFPLTEGDGLYQFTVFENVADDQYATILSHTLEVHISDKFKPFLYPNQYVNFTPQNAAITKSCCLAKGAISDLDVVTNIYNYVIDTISYDTRLAQHVSYDYLPNIDQTLQSKKGICFDYSALMTAMLRSQRIPTKLEVGYSSDNYHAWISTYVDDIGWVDHVIEFNGHSWSLMDPTLAASNDSHHVKNYLKDEGNYIVKYTY
ncbi:MAG: transglutaminase-like domain-containing protein [Lachnospiraceae bacterium]